MNVKSTVDNAFEEISKIKTRQSPRQKAPSFEMKYPGGAEVITLDLSDDEDV